MKPIKKYNLVFLKENKVEYKALGLEKDKVSGMILADTKVDGKWNVLFLSNDKIINGTEVSKEYLEVGEFMIPEEDLEKWNDPDEGKEVSFDGDEYQNMLE